MREINKLIIHCAATPNGRETTVEDIDRWHKARGWQCIGYHYVIYLDGSVHVGRPEEMVGAHAVNQNEHSIGICLIGTDQFTPEQWAALTVLVTDLLKKYPKAAVVGHGDLPSVNKKCPGFNVHWWQMNDYLAITDQIYVREEKQA